MCAKPKTRSPVIELSKGVVLSILIILASAAIFALLIHNQTVTVGAGGIWRYTTVAIAALAGCVFGTNRIGEKPLIFNAIIVGALLFILLATGILFFDGTIHGIGGTLISALVGGVISTMIAMKKPIRKKKFKIRSR